ncbi:MAG TPA: hypothetical protein VK193_12570 [Methyloceanibacter sp.]|nr:hypothetical protein [Methyloceanibacter sp.]
MIRRGLSALLLLLLLQSGALAQTSLQGTQGTQGTQGQSFGNPIPPAQSTAPSPSVCGPGSQSVRVCNNDFQSCNSVCTATALDPTADVAGCGTRCCSQFRACLSIRGCGALTSVNCF